MRACPSSGELEKLLAEQLSPARQLAVETHVEICAACQAVLRRLSDEGNAIHTHRFASLATAPVAACDREFVQQLQAQPPLLQEIALQKQSDPSPIVFPGPASDKGPLGQLDGFAIRKELGAGRFGIVYQACDELDRLVAIKILKPEPAASTRERARFEHEARKAAAVKHDHIVTIHQVGHSPSFALPYLVMEYVEGETLSDRLQRDGMMEPREAAQLLRQMALALAAAHRRGLIHRDIKPSNILVEAISGQAKLTDFGLARIADAVGGSTSQSGRIVGTPAYMSPEQIASPPQVDGRSDIFSLGVVLYELLTGERPFRGAPHLLLQQVVHDEPRAPRKLNDSVPRDLETICLKAMSKAPARRYATARDLAEDLRRFLAREPIQARPVGQLERFWRWSKRNRAVASLTAAVFALLMTVELHTLKGHADVVRSVSWSPDLDGKWLATGSDDGTAKVWEVASGRELRTHKGHARKVWCVSWSPDGRWLATASEDGTAKVWDAANGGELHTLKGHISKVRSVSWSPDGTWLATGSEDGTARIWEAANGQEARTLKGASGIQSVSWSPDGKYLATGSNDGRAKIWEAASGRELFPLMGHTGVVQFVSWSPDGKRLVTASADTTAKLWEAAGGRELLTLQGHTRGVWSVSWSPDGQRLVTGGDDGTAKVWDASSGRELLTLKGHTRALVSVSWSPDGKRLATGSSDGTAKVWEAASPEAVDEWARQTRTLEEFWARNAFRGPHAQGFIQKWLLLLPAFPMASGESAEQALDRQQLAKEAQLRPGPGQRVSVAGRELTWWEYRSPEAIVDFNAALGQVTEWSVIYAISYLESDRARDDLWLQVGSDDQAKVYLNGKQIYQWRQYRNLSNLDTIGPVVLEKGTNVLLFKVVNATEDWRGCMRLVDAAGRPAKEIQVKLTPQ